MYRRIANSRFWEGVHKIGLAPPIKRVYWTLRLHYESYSHQQIIGDITVNFHVPDRDDFVRVDSFSNERNVVRSFLYDIESTDVVFDIGAHIGTYACFASKKAEDGSIVAFEPVSKNNERLRTNLTQNAENWTIKECALSNFDGKTFIKLSDSRGSETIDEDGDITVPTHRGETLIESGDIPSPDVIKIDVEGAEMDVLKGFGDWIEDVRVIYCEIHPKELSKSNIDIKDVEGLLERRGFSIETIETNRTQYHVRALRK